MRCLLLLCTFSSGCAFAVLMVHVCREHCLQSSSTRGQVVLFGNLRYRRSHPGAFVHVCFRAATFAVALGIREPKQINAACAQLWCSLNAPTSHHLDSLTGVGKHTSHMLPRIASHKLKKKKEKKQRR